MSKIEFSDVTFYYRTDDDLFLALEDVELTVEDGEFVCIIGHSGCGKSTLLSLLAGLNRPDAGSVEVNGIPISGPSVDRAMVFQHYSLFPWMTVERNVAFSIEHSRPSLKRPAVRAAADKALRQVFMDHAAKKFPYQLSGGMQQRVAIARALAMDSDILLLDEPFGALDAHTRVELQELLVELWAKSRKKTVVFITHDLDEAITLADRIIFMTPRRVSKVIEVDIPRPRDPDSLKDSPYYKQIREDLVTLLSNTGEE